MPCGLPRTIIFCRSRRTTPCRRISTGARTLRYSRLPLAAGQREYLSVDLITPGFIGNVRDPPSVWRELRTGFLERRLKIWDWFPILRGAGLRQRKNVVAACI